MNTSYFNKYRGNNGVSIALGTPKWFTGRKYPDLAPPGWLLNHYLKYHDWNYYVAMYCKYVLDKLDPWKVYYDLGPDAVLLCHETSDKDCHRFIVAFWLFCYIGVIVLEL